MKKKRRFEMDHHKLMLEDIFLNKIKSSSVEKMIAIALLKLIRQFEDLKIKLDDLVARHSVYTKIGGENVS